MELIILRINMKLTILRTLFFALTLTLFAAQVNAQVTVSGSTGADGTYTQLNLAFTAINAIAQTGNSIVVTITASTTETATATLNLGTWTSLNIYPTTTGLSITGNLDAPLIDFNGAGNVTIDGSVNGVGAAKDLMISNTSVSATAGTSTIRFINDATTNTIKYCTLKGSTMDATGGVVFFSTTTGTTGNDNNTIDNNDITNAADANRPLNAVYSVGTTNYTNNNITISNNHIYNFLNRGTASNGIYFGINTTACTVSGNSFFETATFAPTTTNTAYYIIFILNGENFVVSGNYIGGQSATCSGSAWTKSATAANQFIGISLFNTVAPGNIIQNNTIKNIVWGQGVNSSAINSRFYGIQAKNALIDGNTIGAATGTGSIYLSANVHDNSAGFEGIADFYCTVSNNTVGSISVINPSYPIFIMGISNSGNSTVSNNLIGSLTTPGSLQIVGSASYSTILGIYSNASLSSITNNTIANLRDNASVSVGEDVVGINISGSSTTASATGNTIFNLSNNASGASAPCVIGISHSSSDGVSIENNTIHNIKANAANSAGIYKKYGSPSSKISGNYIYDVAATSGSGYGILINAGSASGSLTCSNNIISLVSNNPGSLYGISETEVASNSDFLYHNTVYLGGMPASGSNMSCALYSGATTNTRNFRNNIFVNARSNNGATGKHYAVYYNYVSNTALTADFNDYYVSGSGGVTGHYGSDKLTLANLQLATANDMTSTNINPIFANGGGMAPTDYIPASTKLFGASALGITTDYAGAIRKVTPSMGAYEVDLDFNVEIWKDGALQNGYGLLRTAFEDVNAGTYTGALDVKIKHNTTETVSATLNASGSGSASYTSINMYPTTNGLSITGNLAAPLIDLNGADNVTIDGRVNRIGTDKDLTLNNTSVAAVAGTSTMRFRNDATTNTVKYCTLKGSTLDAAGGVILFSTATTTGNNNNTIDNNNITNSADANRPLCAVWSVGTSGLDNSGNTISNNNIYDFLNRGIDSKGIYIGSNTIASTVTGNSLYESTTFVPTADVAYYPIYINNPVGTGFNVSGNYIGGQAVTCGGSAWTKTNAFSNVFNGIYMNVGTAPVSNAQNNTIKNISWSNATLTPWLGVYIAGGKVDTSGLFINSGN